MFKHRRLSLAPLQQHSVALISLVVAVLALTLNSDRADRTEHQRNVRDASFAILYELNQLQLLIDQAHYGASFSTGISTQSTAVPLYANPIAGWAMINYMRDLSMVVPATVEGAALQNSLTELFERWRVHVDNLGKLLSPEQKVSSLEANRTLSEHITTVRGDVKQVLISLD